MKDKRCRVYRYGYRCRQEENKDTGLFDFFLLEPLSLNHARDTKQMHSDAEIPKCRSRFTPTRSAYTQLDEAYDAPSTTGRGVMSGAVENFLNRNETRCCVQLESPGGRGHTHSTEIDAFHPGMHLSPISRLLQAIRSVGLYTNNLIWILLHPPLDPSRQHVRVRLDTLLIQCIFVPSCTSWSAAVRARAVKDSMRVSVVRISRVHMRRMSYWLRIGTKVDRV